jgi:ubiquinone/menaquinone biosynthesis C-methylase UbiE
MASGDLHRAKHEAIRQWDTDPCGALGEPQDTPQYWADVDRYRYLRYAPWMRTTFPYDAYRGRRVLEIGVGLGADLMQFAHAGSRCFGVDLSVRHLELTRQRFRRAGIPVGLAQGDVEALPIASASVDVVYAFGVVHHTPDAAGALAEIQRVLRPGGQLWLTVYHRDSLVMLYRLVVVGLLRGQLRSGWRRFLSTIEYRRDPQSAEPLVRLYSRAMLRRALRNFTDVRIVVRHGAQVYGSERRIKRWLKHAVAPISQPFGWYLVARAQRSPREPT